MCCMVCMYVAWYARCMAMYVTRYARYGRNLRMLHDVQRNCNLMDNASILHVVWYIGELEDDETGASESWAGFDDTDEPSSLPTDQPQQATGSSIFSMFFS